MLTDGGLQSRLLFVRFGGLPESERSVNHLTGIPEPGVSVYEAVERNRRVQVLLPSLTGSACVSLSGCLFRKAYEVEGMVVGVGADGEPLLANCRIVRELTREELGATDDWFGSEE